MKIRLLLPLLIASLSTAYAVTAPSAFIAYPSLAKTGYSAPGGTDITFGTLGLAAINPNDEVIFENRLIGSGSSLGRKRALFAYRGTTTELTLLAGTSFGLGLPTGTKFTSFLSPIHNRSTSTAVFQATISGPGISSTSNRVILQDNNGSPSVITRTGIPFPSLGNASPSSFVEVLQQEGANDRLAIIYKLKASTTSTPATKSNNDSGLLLMTHAGAVTHSIAREGSPTFVSPGSAASDIFGQFNRAAILNGNAVAFTSKVIPPIGKPVDSLFLTGAVSFRSNLTQGTTPPALTAGELLGTFTGVGRIDSAVALLRTTLTKSPRSTNEAVWNSGGTLLLRKGQDIGSSIKITRILRVWGINNGQLLAHVQLSNKATALILRQTTNGFLTLISTRTQAPSFISGVDVAAIQAIDVDPVNGHYVVLGSLKGLGSTENQALWTGQTTLGTDMAPQARLPTLQLQKGSVFVSTNTSLNLIRSISIRPAVDPTGVGARGFGQQINPSGATLVTLTGDRGIKELILLNPSNIMGIIFSPR